MRKHGNDHRKFRIPCKLGLQFPPHANSTQSRFHRGPEKFRLAGEIAKKRNFVDLRKVRDIARACSLIPVARKQLYRRLDDTSFSDTIAWGIFHEVVPLLEVCWASNKGC